jgi:hypothetical protein
VRVHDKNAVLKVAAYGLWGGAVCSAILGFVLSLRFQYVPGLDQKLFLIGGGMAVLYALGGCLAYPGLVFKPKEDRPG